MNVRRRYQALRARAKDQRGTPEADLCSKLADALQQKYGIEDEEERPVGFHEIKFADRWEKETLTWLAEYFQVEAGEYKDKRMGGRLVVECDDVTFHLIEQAFAVLQPKLEDLVRLTLSGFLTAAVPVPGESSRRTLSFEQLRAVLRGAARGSRVRIIKALTDK